MINLIVNSICATIVIASIALCGGPKWGAFGFGMVVFTIWTAYDMIVAKIDGLER